MDSERNDLGSLTPMDDALFGDVASLIDSARQRVAASVNSELVMLYWSIGKRVREDVLGGERAAYGQDTVKRLAARLTVSYGRGYSYSALTRMMKFADMYPEGQIVAPLAQQLTWTNITELLTISDQLDCPDIARTIEPEPLSCRSGHMVARGCHPLGRSAVVGGPTASTDMSSQATCGAYALVSPHAPPPFGLRSDSGKAALVVSCGTRGSACAPAREATTGWTTMT
ncbi:MAG: DUF1016 N-terminal domain-containing protein [Coriobacteriia bacterium]